MNFHDEHVVLRFPVISDLHIMGPGQETSEKLDRAFAYLQQFGPQDCVFFPGDLTDFGLPEQMAEFHRIMQRYYDLDQTKLLFCFGNHELYRHELLGAPLTLGRDFIRTFQGKVFEGATNEEIESGNHMVILKGVAFIMLNCHQYSGGVDFRPQDKAWLKRALERAERETDPSKPIFVCSHPMIVGTCYGSSYQGDGGYYCSSQLYDIMAQHKRAVYFSGHLHFPLQNELDIWQKEFTAIGTSSAYFVSLEAEDPDEKEVAFADIAVGSEPEDTHAFSQGLLVEVDDLGQTRITRLDFYRQCVIKEPWLLPSPAAYADQPMPYAREERRLPQPPKFPENAQLIADFEELDRPISTLKLYFTAAESEDMVEFYHLKFVDDATKETLKEVGLYSDFYTAPNGAAMKKELEKQLAPGKLLPFSLYGTGSFHMELIPHDCFGQTGDTLCSPSYERLPEGMTDSRLRVPSSTKFSSFLRFNHLPLDGVLVPETDYACWPPVERGDGASSLFVTANNSERVITALLSSGCDQFYQFTKPFPMDAGDADQVWLWLDCEDLVFSRLYFSFLCGGELYSTDGCNGRDMKAYIKERGLWKAVSFSYDGCLEQFGHFRGYLRFSTDYLRHSSTGAAMPAGPIEAFRIGFSGANEELAGKTVSLGDIKFSREK